MNSFEADFEQEKKVMMAYMRAHPQVTNAEVLDQVGGPTTRRTHFLRTLRKRGEMVKVGRRATEPLYTVLAPEEAQARAAGKRATPKGAMWAAMRERKKFTQGEVISALAGTKSPVTEAEARSYCTSLLSAGYLKVLQKARSASGRPARYMLVRDSGPLPPDIKRMQVVVDPNEDRVVHVQGARL